VEANRMEVEKSIVYLPGLIREVGDHLQGQVLDKDIALIADVPDAVENIISDGNKIRHILINLAGNAIKFTNQGSVTVRLIANVSTGQPERIDVVDSGIGISQERHSAVFDAFSQADSSVSRKYGGTGLGLSISKSMAALLGCDLSVSSEEGIGSTFTLSFNHHEDERSGELNAYTTSAPDSVDEEELLEELADKRILLIEASADIREVFHHYLEATGSLVIDADNGLEGMAMAISSKPDLIILDLQLPTMNGWEVLLRIRNSPNLVDIPLLVVSESESASGIVLGSVLSLTLPLERVDLQRGIYHCLRMKRRQYKPHVLMAGFDQKTFTDVASVLEVDRTDLRISPEMAHIRALVPEFDPDLILLDSHLLAGKSLEEKSELISCLMEGGSTFAILIDEPSLVSRMEGIDVDKMEFILTSQDFRKQLKDLIRQACQGKVRRDKELKSDE